MLNLDIGSDNNKKTGYIGIDIYPHSQTDIVLDVEKQKLPFKNDEVDNIYSSHTFEHFSLKGVDYVLKECYRVLKKEGKLTIIVPSIKSCLKKFLESSDEDRWNDSAKMIWGSQTILGQYHKSGFTPERLRKLLLKWNFNIIELIEFPWNEYKCIKVIAKK